MEALVLAEVLEHQRLALLILVVAEVAEVVVQIKQALLADQALLFFVTPAQFNILLVAQ
jgi:hypothetical protein